jgi:hypothetical protein
MVIQPDLILLGYLDKLTTTGFTFVLLIAVMDEAVFDQVFRFAAWATWHWS